MSRAKGVKVRDMLTLHCVLAQHPDWWVRVRTTYGRYWLCAEHAAQTPLLFTTPHRVRHPPFVAQCEDCRTYGGGWAWQQLGRAHRISSNGLNINNLPRRVGKSVYWLGFDPASAPDMTVVELKPF